MTKNSKLIIEEAISLGLTIDVISENHHLFTVNKNGKSVLIYELFSLLSDPSAEAYRLSKDKNIMYILWERNGIPFPKYHHFKNLKEFKERARILKFDYPVITKETSGSKSMNVYMDIRSFSELEKTTSKYDQAFVVQEMALGNEYRLLMYKGKLLGALEMHPPQVIGDGVSTVDKLIEDANMKRVISIKISRQVILTLEKSELTLESIPEKGAVVFLQKNSRLAEGGSSRDCTDRVNEKIAALAWKASQATNLNLGGVDLICEDISLPPEAQKVLFLEVNTYPDLSIHYFPTEGKPRHVIRPILQDLFSL